MDVTDDRDRRIHMHDVGLAHEHLFCLFAYLAQEGLVKELFAEELLDAGVEIEGSHLGRDWCARGSRVRSHPGALLFVTGHSKLVTRLARLQTDLDCAQGLVSGSFQPSLGSGQVSVSATYARQSAVRRVSYSTASILPCADAPVYFPTVRLPCIAD